MGGANVLEQDTLVPGCLGQIDSGHLIAIQETFNSLASRWLGRAAVIRFELEAVEARRIVTGGNHYAADRSLLLDRQRDRRGRSRLRGQHDAKAVARKHVRSALAECVRAKTPI